MPSDSTDPTLFRERSEDRDKAADAQQTRLERVRLAAMQHELAWDEHRLKAELTARHVYTTS
jgi:hypothetical protein